MKGKNFASLVAFVVAFFVCSTWAFGQQAATTSAKTLDKNGNIVVVEFNLGNELPTKVDPSATVLKGKEALARINAGYFDIPGFEFTGNPAVDQENYKIAKQNFMANNTPEEIANYFVENPGANATNVKSLDASMGTIQLVEKVQFTTPIQ